MPKITLLTDLFFKNRFFVVWGCITLSCILTYFFPLLSVFVWGICVFFLALSLLDYGLLFFTRNSLIGARKLPVRFSNAEANTVHINLSSSYAFRLNLTYLDELPVQFQQRDFQIQHSIEAKGELQLNYSLMPTQRGEYEFGNIHLYISSKIGLVQRRFTIQSSQTVKVYPSFLQLRNYQLKALAEQNLESRGRRLYRRGLSTEFEHVKEYTRGDDSRSINWKASARRDQLMVNSFMDEKSQQIFCLIDKGRMMKMSFNGITLLDYAINATLMFSYVALQKDDKIGLITFAEKTHEVLQPAKLKKQFNVIMETLYKQETRFLESNFEDVYLTVNKRAGQRSLLLLFTNFETITGFMRQLPYLKVMNKKHLLCVVLFENTEVSRIHDRRGDALEDIYVKTIADRFIYEKKMIVKELQKHGILAIYTKPEQLTIQVVNKYLALKAKQFI
ncbi:MAG: DUF58 domain-containing protein [Bacteroidetes bacterium]|nr:DUF58 domain-containing protein [Bacteroidota bacterium]